MIVRIITGLLLGSVFLTVLFFLPPVFLAILLALMCAEISHELLRATKVEHSNGMYLLTALSAAFIPLGQYLGFGNWTLRACSLVLMAALFFIAIRNYATPQEICFEKVMVCLFAGLMIPISLTAILVLKQMEYGQYFALLPVLCAFFSDIGAYFVGVLFGKHRGVTKVSPNKSVEGYAGGIFFGALVMLLYGLLVQRFVGIPVSLPVMALYGLMGGVITELGDLSFSLVKRQYGIKDYGTLFPGHGGVLDRFDSMIFAAPAMLLLVELIPLY